MDAATKLREVYESPGITLQASVQDGLSARLAQFAGFPAATLGGATVTNSLLGLPDSGFLTLTEMEFVCSRISAVCDMPLLVDVDSGYGNAINVVRTVRTLERAGAGGILLEDQVDPPRCGHVSGHVLVSAAEMVGKVKAALDSRKNHDFVVIARTDARSVEGLESAIERGQQYIEAGADGFLVDGLMSVDEMQTVTKEVPARIHLVNLGGSSAKATTPKPSLDELEPMGYHVVTTGMSALRTSALALLNYYQDVRRMGPDRDMQHRQEVVGTPLEEWYGFTGFDWVRGLEERYLPQELLDQRYKNAEPGYYEPRASDVLQ